MKYDNLLTDVLWGHHSESVRRRLFKIDLINIQTDYNHKILTGTRSGELIIWDLQKTGSSKYGEGVYFGRYVNCCLKTVLILQSGRLGSIPEQSTNSHIRLLSRISAVPVRQMVICDCGFVRGVL